MGRGDKRTKKGKRTRASYGNSRPKTKADTRTTSPRKATPRGR